jgi:hypothetical protein
VKKLLLNLLLAAVLCPAAARAEISVGGWSVSEKPDDGVCTASREYKDRDDDNKENAVVLALGTAKDGERVLIVSLAYEGWAWDKDEMVKADFKVGNKMIHKASTWKAPSKTNLVSTFKGPAVDTYLETLGTGQKMFLTFDKDSEANFLIPNVGMALGAVKLCLGAGR